MFKKLRKKLTLICTLSTGIILLLMAAGFLYLAEQQLIRRGESEFLSRFQSVLSAVQDQKIISQTWLRQNEAGENLLISVEENGTPFQYQGAWDPALRGRLIAEAKQIAERDFGFSPGRFSGGQTEPFPAFQFTSETGGRYYAAAGAVISRTAVELYVIKPMEPEQKQILTQRVITGCLVGLAVLALWGFAWSFTGRAVRPIEESRERQTAFVSAASHELRAPLTVLRTGISALEKAPPGKREHFLSLMSLETNRMSRLVDDMLFLAGTDNGKWSVQLKPVELESLLVSVLERYEPEADRNGVRLCLNLPDEILPKCNCDRERIEQVLAILLDNALRYSPSGGSVLLSAKPSGRDVQISVTDSGPGIPDGLKPHVFERFFRGDSSRTEKGHFGLGLSIAQEMVSLHHGKIILTDSPEGGCCFTVVLPLPRTSA